MRANLKGCAPAHASMHALACACIRPHTAFPHRHGSQPLRARPAEAPMVWSSIRVLVAPCAGAVAPDCPVGHPRDDGRWPPRKPLAAGCAQAPQVSLVFFLLFCGWARHCAIQLNWLRRAHTCVLVHRTDRRAHTCVLVHRTDTNCLVTQSVWGWPPEGHCSIISTINLGMAS